MGWFGRRRTTVGLDVGSRWAKLVEVDHGGGRPEVVGAGAARVPEGAVVDGEVVDADLVTESVRGLVADVGARGPDVVVAMGGHDVFVKKVEMKRAKRSALRAAIEREAERLVPFDIDSVELDHHTLGAAGDGRRVDVLLVAAKREAVAARVDVVARAGLNPVLVDVEAFALHNAFTCNYGRSAEDAVALVDIRRESATVNVLEGAAPLLAGDVPIGPSAAWAAEGDEAPPAGGRTSAVEEAAEALAAAVERASALLAARRSPTGLGRVFLSGSGACVPGLAESLARRVGVETRLANPFERVPVRSGARCRGISLNRSAPMLLLALGLALRTP